MSDKMTVEQFSTMLQGMQYASPQTRRIVIDSMLAQVRADERAKADARWEMVAKELALTWKQMTGRGNESLYFDGINFCSDMLTDAIAAAKESK